MVSLFRVTLIALLVFPPFFMTAVDDSAKTPFDEQLASADQRYRSGKFAQAEKSYQTIVQKNGKLVAAQVGLVQSMLKQQKIDDALDAVNKALTSMPDSPPLLAVRGNVQFRRGEMLAAEKSYLRANIVDEKEVRGYVGLARLYASYSLYRKAYDLLERAHTLAPDDVEVQREWLWMLLLKERMAALQAYLAGPHPDDQEETQGLQEYLDFLEATIDKPVHACKLASNIDQTDTKLEIIRRPDGGSMGGVGLSVELNDHYARLLLDTGAGGIVVNRKLAEKAGLIRISSERYGGIGDKGLQSGYAALADHIRVGKLEFRDCIVSVSDKRLIGEADGLIGADVFGAYLVDIDSPGMRLRLSPLPRRPEDAVAATSLNSEGEQQATVEQKEESTNEQDSEQRKPAVPEPRIARQLPKDGYIAPEMTNWTKVFRFGHLMLVPTSVNASSAKLFIIDTGAFDNILSLREGLQLGRVNPEDRYHVSGISGEVNKVYSAKATLRFGHVQQESMDVVTFDLSASSRDTGTEVSGLLGFALLRLLELKLDYRDGLANFEYNSKRVRALQR